MIGIVGRDGGYTAKVAAARWRSYRTVNPEHVTPFVEAFQAIVWHRWSRILYSSAVDEVGVRPMSRGQEKTCPPASWSAIAGVMLRPVAALHVTPCIST